MKNEKIFAELKHITRREFIKLTGTISASLLTTPLASSDKPGSKPNIILIISDDIGYGDIGVHGCKDIPTPGIDSIAENGIKFKNGYVSSPLCSPSRAGLMTGRYQQKFGYEFNPGPPPNSLRPKVGLPLEETTLAETLRSSGYRTSAVGKWHLGMREEFHPLKRGFDSFFGFLHGGHKYFYEENEFNPIMRNYTPVKEKEYLTKALTREAISFIGKNKKNPFFLYLSYNAAHTPLQADESKLKKFVNIKDQKRKTYAAMISALDDGISDIINKLKNMRILENTIIFFLNDNGGSKPNNGSSNFPLRGGKGSLHEGGIRVPFLMQWKGTLPEKKEFKGIVSSLDIFPTSVNAAGGTLPGKDKIDGINLLPFLLKKRGGEPHNILYWRAGRNRRYFAVRRGKWKFLQQGKKPVELYNIEDDISERNNIAEDHPALVAEMKELIRKWNSTLKKPLWMPPRLRSNKKKKIT